MSFRKSLAMKNQVLQMYQSHVPLITISRALGISRNTVRRIVRESGIKTEQELLKGKILQENTKKEDMTINYPWLAGVNLEEILEKRKKGRSFKVLHKDYEVPISYDQFRKVLNKLLLKKEGPAITLKLQHEPGKSTFVDYADGILICDPKTGEKRKTQFFCGVLPFSSYTFGEFSWDQKLESFIPSHERMWQYFGGITPYVVSDNLKSAVQKSHRYDPDINPTFCEYGNKRGFSLLPARPRRPKDKAAVETAIGVIQRSFFQQVADKNFYSLEELNFFFQEFLDDFNNVKMKDYGISRRERFEEEKGLLKPPPGEIYELSSWKEVKVHPDCHVQILKCFYSVPSSYAGETLRARIYQNRVEMFTSEGKKVAEHKKFMREVIGRYSTDNNHYPEERVKQTQFNIEMAISSAKAIGPKTLEMVEHLFNNPYPLKRLRFIQGVLRLAKGYPKSSLEHACQQAMRFNKLRFSFISNCTKHYSSHCESSVSAPLRNPELIYTYSTNNLTQENTYESL